jgi:uracil-DNA glycosylase
MSKTWYQFLKEETEKEYYVNSLAPFLREEYANNECYPIKDNIFNAFKAIPTPLDVKVVIIGQDPYHEPGQANGLAFSVSPEVALPPSLKNIYKEISDEFNLEMNMTNGDLTYLANQGVLLLNNTLTVRKGQANSHEGKGWTEFTDNMITKISDCNTGIVFMLWGKFAQSKESLINKDNNHLILKTSHPSPFSAKRGFLGCGHFKTCNEFLIANGKQPIVWQNS